MTDHVAGKVIVVTGAASGFGRLVCQKAVARGALVVGADIDEAGLAETAASLGDAADSMASVRCDVTRLEDVRAAVALAIERYGRIDVMLNNAGTMPLAFYGDHEAAMAAWERCIDINIKGVLHGIVAAYDPMMAQGRGHVINVSSIYGNFPVVGAGVYGASKAAVNMLSESLRMEARGRIKVTIVKPTGVPATNLGTGIVNPEAIVGILGHNMAGDAMKFEAMAAGQLPAEETDADHPANFALAPEYLADAIIHAIDQPWGVSVGEITMRATGDGYIL